MEEQPATACERFRGQRDKKRPAVRARAGESKSPSDQGAAAAAAATARVSSPAFARAPAIEATGSASHGPDSSGKSSVRSVSERAGRARAERRRTANGGAARAKHTVRRGNAVVSSTCRPIARRGERVCYSFRWGRRRCIRFLREQHPLLPFFLYSFYGRGASLADPAAA